MFIQERNEKSLFRDERNNVYSVKKYIVLIQRRNEVFIQGNNE